MHNAGSFCALSSKFLLNAFNYPLLMFCYISASVSCRDVAQGYFYCACPLAESIYFSLRQVAQFTDCFCFSKMLGLIFIVGQMPCASFKCLMTSLCLGQMLQLSFCSIATYLFADQFFICTSCYRWLSFLDCCITWFW